jgi:hypothetical protein
MRTIPYQQRGEGEQTGNRRRFATYNDRQDKLDDDETWIEVQEF